jgi:hypothetical protein
MKKLVETVPVMGIFGMKVFQSGKLIEETVEQNLIVDGAKLQMARLLAGDASGRNIAGIAFGTSSLAPDAADTLITNQWSKPIAGFSFPNDGHVRFDWKLLTTENNGMAILEFGLLCADGTLFARRTRQNPIHKASDISIEGHWAVIFNA